jgi:hypothetical protein
LLGSSELGSSELGSSGLGLKSFLTTKVVERLLPRLVGELASRLLFLGLLIQIREESLLRNFV